MRVEKLSGIVIRLAVILLCLVLFSAHLTSGMFARYSAEASVNDEARVAQYAVDVSPVGDGEFTFDSNGNGSYQFKLINRSEVPVRYELTADISVNTDKIHPLSDEDAMYTRKRVVQNVKLDGVGGVANNDYSAFTFPELNGVLEPGASTDTLELTLVTDIAAIYSKDDSITQHHNQWDYEWVPVNVNIFAKSEQIN